MGSRTSDAKTSDAKTSDTKLIGLFLDMLAAEQGAGPNTLDAYRRDLTDFSEFLARGGQGFAGAETQGLRDYLADLDRRGLEQGVENHLAQLFAGLGRTHVQSEPIQQRQLPAQSVLPGRIACRLIRIGGRRHRGKKARLP